MHEISEMWRCYWSAGAMKLEKTNSVVCALMRWIKAALTDGAARPDCMWHDSQLLFQGSKKKCLFTSEAFAYSTVATLTQVTLYIHLSSSNNPFSISLCSLALPVEGDCDFSPRSHINTQRDEPTCVRHNTPCVSWGTLTTEESN